MATTNRRRWFIVGILVLLGAVAAGNLFQFIVKSHFEAEAHAWLRHAQRSALADMTYDDARRWLDSHGFGVIHWNPHDDRGWIGQGEITSQGSTQYRSCVQGGRQLTSGNILWDPIWVDLTFIFHRDGAFDRVEMATRSLAIP